MAGHEKTTRERWNDVRRDATQLYVSMIKMRDVIPANIFKSKLKETIDIIRVRIDELEQNIPE